MENTGRALLAKRSAEPVLAYPDWATAVDGFGDSSKNKQTALWASMLASGGLHPQYNGTGRLSILGLVSSSVALNTYHQTPTWIFVGTLIQTIFRL